MTTSEIRLRFFGYASSTDHKNAFRSWSGGPTEYRNIKIVDDDSYTHVVLYYNSDSPNKPNIKHILKTNIVAFCHEPFEILSVDWNWINDNVGTCFVHDRTKVPQLACIREGICYLPPGVPVGEVRSSYPKSHKMSMVATNKGMFEGHRLRHQIINRILKSNMDIHIWGRGMAAMYGHDPRVKGSTETKQDMFAPYQYSIAIENAKYPWWVTEKFYDPILTDTIPLYWGAPKISSVFNNSSYIELPSSVDAIMDIITEVYLHPGNTGKSPVAAKTELLGNKSFQHFLWEVFNNGKT